MPKQKTHKGTKKRFRLTASGKAKHRQSGTSHLQTRMSQKRKRNLRGTAWSTSAWKSRFSDASEPQQLLRVHGPPTVSQLSGRRASAGRTRRWYQRVARAKSD